MKELREMLKPICARVPRNYHKALEQVISVAIELSLEGREGHRVGSLFILGDSEAVLAHSRLLILDPLHGHPEEVRQVDRPEMRATIKELAQLDGAFVLTASGEAESACRIIDIPASDVDFPMGLGSRHFAAASITHATDAAAVVLSKSSVIRVFYRGDLIGEILPGQWLPWDVTVHMRLPYSQSTQYGLTVLSKGAAEKS
jgi:diadenylate cyclase